MLKGKKALVTGATRGIGLAIAKALLEKGADVLICASTASDVEATVDALKASYGEHIMGMACDARDYASVQSVLTGSDNHFGGIDILINNAGIGLFKNVEETEVGEWNRLIETNLTGVFYFCREAIPRMKRRGGGYIINIGSLAGKEAFAGAAAYCASKFALVGFSEALMQEVRFDHIRVSYVMPGSVNTSFGRHSEHPSDQTWKLLPEDVAEVVISLLEMDSRALASRVELRPSEPGKGSLSRQK